MVQDHGKQSKKPVVQPDNEKRAKQTPKKHDAHSTPEKLARGAQTTKLHAAAKEVGRKPAAHSKATLGKEAVSPEKLARGAQTTKLHAAAKEVGRKPAAHSKATLGKEAVSQKPLARVKKVQDHSKLPKQTNDAATSHRIIKRATGLSHKRGVLGSADVSKGPFILEVDDRKGSKRRFKPGKKFAHAKRNESNRDTKAKNHKRKFPLNGHSLRFHPRTILYSIINSTSGQSCSVAFI